MINEIRMIQGLMFNLTFIMSMKFLKLYSCVYQDNN